MTPRIARRHLAALLTGPLLAVPSSAGEAPPGAIRFEARNLLTTAHGEFRSWRIHRALVDERSPERSVIEVAVDLASVDTGIGTRDAHLRSEDFFDVERFPTARVRLENFHLLGADRVSADATLELHGVTRRFPMEFRITDRAARSVEGRVTLRRSDFGVGGPVRSWNPLSVRDEVRVHVEARVPPADVAIPAPAD